MSNPTPFALPPGAPQPGDLLAGKYRVERVLGVGGMGIVVQAQHLELDEPVAVKFLLPHGPPPPDAVARFVREAKAAIKIKSDHVVRVIDTGRLDGGAPYIVMEYLDGSDLHALVEREGPLAIDVAVDYVLQACDAIAAAHALGIVHRDLKPGNLFLTRKTDGSPLVKVLDFGISKVTNADVLSGSAITTTATVMGTPAFMSPEQLRSTRAVDARTDIWSMGTILFALLTGAPPYNGETTADIAAKIIRDPPPPLRALRPDAPAGLEAVIARCLEKDLEARFPGVAELAQALVPFASAASRASAERITRAISSRQLGHAATMKSSGAQAPAPTSPATRTASAWGETKDPPTKGPRTKPVIAIAIAGAAVIGATLAMVIPRGGTPVRVAASASAMPGTTATAAASASASASASAAASASASAFANPSPSAYPFPSKPRPHPKTTKPAPSAAPSASATGGLFDDRE